MILSGAGISVLVISDWGFELSGAWKYRLTPLIQIPNGSTSLTVPSGVEGSQITNPSSMHHEGQIIKLVFIREEAKPRKVPVTGRVLSGSAEAASAR